LRLARPKAGNPDRRMRWGLAAVLCVFGLFGARLVQLQGLDSAALAAKAIASRSYTDKLPAQRGDILDATGAVMATTVERDNITVDQRIVNQYRVRDKVPLEEKGVPGAAAAMAPILGMSVSALEKSLTGRRPFAYVIKGVEPNVWRAVSDLKIPGIYDEQASQRTYPGGSVAANVLGFVGQDGTALAGVEFSKNSLLKGSAGKQTYEKGAGGQEIPVGTSSGTAAVPGRNIQLTIDSDLQWKTQEALSAAVKETGSASGSVVVMTRTGDVLALADAPTFNSNQPGKAKPADLGDRALLDVFEPGSTSKVITAAAALQEGKATPTSKLKVPGILHRGGKYFHDAETHGTEKLTLAGVLAKSSNIGAIEVGERLSPTTMYDYLTKFGIGSQTGVGLPEERGLLAKPQDWNSSQRYTILFGQGLSVTALQSASVFATVANNGVRVQPRVIQAISDPTGKLQPQPQGRSTRVISTKVAKELQLMLESVVSDDGTAVKATIPGYRVAGKTGTADAYDTSCSCYRGHTASFVGMAPADNPQLVVAVYLQQPKSNYYGGTVAAPVFQQVMTYALANEKVVPTGTKAPKVPLEWH
jgi:cell division protein FtsI (penicillin-binding protein 3)